MTNDTIRAWAEIHTDAFVHNLAIAKKLTEKKSCVSSREMHMATVQQSVGRYWKITVRMLLRWHA